MKDYQPVDLKKICNAGVTFLSPNAKPAIGKQEYHGLPFSIASNSKRCFLGFGLKPIMVPIRKRARHVIFAHALLESKLMRGDPVGRVIAHYVFHYANENTTSSVSVPIRERFEICIVPTAWGQWPFLSLPDRKSRLRPRYQGEWAATGWRQTETIMGDASNYYLWAWKNPHPECVIESVAIEPVLQSEAARKFIVAAITLGNADEPPFARTAKREVKITLPKKKDAEQSFGLEVDVNRGVATFPFALPAISDDQFLKQPNKGWGEFQNKKSNPAYVEVSATPSATVTVKNHGKELGCVKWADLEKKRRIRKPRVELEIVDRGKNWVHVTVLDDATNKPVPCRVHFRSSEGIPYQPYGHHNHLNSNLDTWHIDIGGDLRLGQITYAYIDGTCQGWLPRGEVIADVARGYEYEPLRTRVKIERGQRELTLRLLRMTNMNDRRWFSGDSHVHFLGAQGAHCEASGEDLNVVNLLASQWGHLFTNTEDFIGRPTVSSDGRTIVYCSQENRQHMLGHLTLWGLKKPVMPWCTDGPSESELGGHLEITMANWADACRAQGGTVILPHIPNPNGEPAALVATGRIDAVEMLGHGIYNHGEYYRYLNNGYRLPLVGGTDKMSGEVAVGHYRTYAYVPADEEFNYDNWCRAVRAGCTFLSGGPMISFTVNGANIGDTLRLGRNGGTVEIEATTESILPIYTLQIVEKGRVVASTDEKKGSRRLQLRAKLNVGAHTWLSARCGGPGYQPIQHFEGWQRGIFAHTSPIYVACGGEWQLFDADTAQYMLTLIDGSLEYIRRTALHVPHGRVTHHHGEEDHHAFLERPFHEAREAIHRRMHQFGIPH